MADPPTREKKPPPRRLRSLNLYISPDFSPAAHAAALSRNGPAEAKEALFSLRVLRDELASSLQASAPEWAQLVPSVDALTKALRTTQSAHKLRESLDKLSASSLRDDYAERMNVVLKRASQLSANTALLSSAREFLQHVAAADAIATSAEHNQTVSTSQGASTVSSAQPSSRTVVPRTLSPSYLAHAVALQKARVAADAPGLSAVRALDKPRAALQMKHADLLADLEAAIVQAVFAGPVMDDARLGQSMAAKYKAGSSMSGRSRTSASIRALQPCKVPLHADLVRAIDTMGGAGKAASVLIAATHSSLVAVIRDAFVTENAPSRTVASFASSSFTMGPPSRTATFSVHSGASCSSRYSRQMFGRDLSPTNRTTCDSIFERVRMRMMGILRRMIILVDSVSDEAQEMRVAFESVWEVMQPLLVSFVSALLGVNVSKSLPDTSGMERMEGGSGENGVSLLPFSTKTCGGGNVEGADLTWTLGHNEDEYCHSFSALVDSMSTLSASIYNLEIIYTPLQQFIVSTEELLQSVKQRRTREHESGQAGDDSPTELTLRALLCRTVDIFVRTVRQDVQEHVQDALGNRAGTLLQPPASRNSHLPGASSHVLPALPQTLVLVDVIASCLALGIAIPAAARRLGEAVNVDVIKPFAERAIYALNLAESWTDSGALVRELRIHGSGASADHQRTYNAFQHVRVNGSRYITTQKQKGRPWCAIRETRDKAGQCLDRMYRKKKLPTKKKGARLLDEGEWNAVVRVIASAKILIAELESCSTSGSDWDQKEVVGSSGSSGSADGQDSSSSLRLRSILRARGLKSELRDAVTEAIGKTKRGCQVLQEEVIDRGVVLLHAEVVLHCFSNVVAALTGDSGESEQAPRKKKNGVTEPNGENRKAEDVNRNGYGLTKPSSIFKVSTLQVHDVEQKCNETRQIEYDEFGDPITHGSDPTADVAMDEYGCSNGQRHEHGEWNSQRENKLEHGVEDSFFSKQSQEMLTEADRRAVESGEKLGESLLQKDLCIKWNLSTEEHSYVFCQADEGVAIGIRTCGDMKGCGDRDMASAARLFLDSAAGAAADTIGWPLVDSNYSVAEGASASGSECRALLYAAGLPI